MNGTPSSNRTCLFVAAPQHRPLTAVELACPRPHSTVQPPSQRDYFFSAILLPALTNFGYQTTIATHVGDHHAPTQRVIRDLLDYDLVVFDLSSTPHQIGLDLGRREAIGRPLLVSMHGATTLPPGFGHLDPVCYSSDDAPLCDEARIKLNKLLAAILSGHSTIGRPFFHQVGSPLTVGTTPITRTEIGRIEEYLLRSRRPDSENHENIRALLPYFGSTDALFFGENSFDRPTR